jgi:hypothetical protein
MGRYQSRHHHQVLLQLDSVQRFLKGSRGVVMVVVVVVALAVTTVPSSFFPNMLNT